MPPSHFEADAEIFKMECKNILLELCFKLFEKSPLKKRLLLGASCLSPSVLGSEFSRNSQIKLGIKECIETNQMTLAEDDKLRGYNRFCELETVKEMLKNYNWKKERLDVLFSAIFKSSRMMNKPRLCPVCETYFI